MSTALYYKGKIYADTMGTYGVGLQNPKTNKAFVVDGKKYAICGTLGGWCNFKSIVLEKNPLKKGIQYIYRLNRFKKDPAYVVEYDDKKKTLTVYNQTDTGWVKQRQKVTGEEPNVFVKLGSGSAYITDDHLTELRAGRLVPEDLMEIAMKNDPYTGGRIAIL